MRILFICSRNRLRSPTAEAVFSACRNVEALSAGTAPDAETVVSADLIEWADLIVVMEAVHRKRLRSLFPDVMHGKKVACLGIPDRYTFMESKLVDLLRTRMAAFLPGHSEPFATEPPFANDTASIDSE